MHRFYGDSPRSSIKERKKSVRVPKDKYPSRNLTAHAVAAIGAAIMVAAPFCAEAAPRWSVEKAKAWGEANPWWCGVNYIPANAINYTAMWDKTGFSPDVIRRELRLMTELGMNCVRFVMQYKVYETIRSISPRRWRNSFRCATRPGSRLCRSSSTTARSA